MPDDRLIRILAGLAADDGSNATTRLCVVCAEVTEMSGAGIMLVSSDRPHGSVCATNPVAALIEELQFTLGEGPCVDAQRSHQPIVEPDLANPAVMRWPAFGPPAVSAGARAVFGFPVAMGDVRLGALNLYRDRPGPLSDRQWSDALLVADVAARAIMGMQVGAVPGSLGAELDTGTNFRFVVHQAAGMVAVQLGVPVDEALTRIRAFAFSHDRRITDVALDVIERRLRFDILDHDAYPEA